MMTAPAGPKNAPVTSGSHWQQRWRRLKLWYAHERGLMEIILVRRRQGSGARRG